MDSPFESSAIRYGIGLSSAVMLVIVAFMVLEGTMRWLVMGIAVVEAVLTPQLLKMSVN